MTTLPANLLLQRLRDLAVAEGLEVTNASAGHLDATRETPLGRWFLGGRKAVYRVACDLDDAAREVRLRESTTERSWGIPLPSLTVETTSQRGARVTKETTVKTPAGGGAFDIGRFRGVVDAAAAEAGWRLRLEPGRRP